MPKILLRDRSDDTGRRLMGKPPQAHLRHGEWWLLSRLDIRSRAIEPAGVGTQKPENVQRNQAASQLRSR